jgi:ABC-type molybdate transport system substrate-binding protein
VANAAVVYYSRSDTREERHVDIIRFPDSVNLSDAIRNAATVPGTARNAKEATELVRFLVSAEAQAILQRTGQPPVVPALRKGTVPVAID